MSIAPVESFPPAGNVQLANTSVARGQPQARPAPTAVVEAQPRPVSGTPPKQENAVPKSVATTYELPQDVVEVHQDPANKGQIIIQYLDKAGDVVVQIPSSQELSVERGIAEEFQQAAKLRASESAAAEVGGEKTHGNQL
ncbi:MAG: hypothetical protein ACHP9V_02285 [Terriglobales bacterium]